MNILLTNICNQQCAYCFAKGKIGEGKKAGKGHYITLENIGKVLKFAKRTNEKTIGVLGGEPTLHPQFEKVIELIISNGFFVRLFTNGIMRNETVQFLKSYDPEKLQITLNVNYQGSYKQGQWGKLTSALRALNRITIPGHTIHDLKFDGKWLIELIKKYDLRKNIRLGIAAPLFGSDNTYISLRDHKRLGENVMRFSRECDDSGIQIIFDCGFRLCSFTEKQIGQLYYNDNAPLFSCPTVIDVNVDLTLWRCFATSNIFNAKLGDFKDLNAAREFFDKKFEKLRAVGADPACLECKHLAKKTCRGGCIGHTLKSFKAGPN